MLCHDKGTYGKKQKWTFQETESQLNSQLYLGVETGEVVPHSEKLPAKKDHMCSITSLIPPKRGRTVQVDIIKCEGVLFFLFTSHLTCFAFLVCLCSSDCL